MSNRLEPWREHQWKLAEEIVNAGILDDLDTAKLIVYDGIIAFVSWDEIASEESAEWVRNRVAYRIAERIVMGKEFYLPGYHEKASQDEENIRKLAQVLVLMCPSIGD